MSSISYEPRIWEQLQLCYKTCNTPVYLSAYLPAPTTLSNSARTTGNDNELTSKQFLAPVVLYFHGGGLTVGDRLSWFPTWLCERVISLGFIFISADYQLIPPATGHEIVQDLKDLFLFLEKTNFEGKQGTWKGDCSRIAVTGSSAGGLCAYLASMHCSPKPKALVSLYGMGGSFLIPHYVNPKNTIFFRGRELLDPADFAEYLHPFNNNKLIPLSESPLSYHSQDYHIPGYPSNPRMLLARLLLQLGIYLDYYTGLHAPSLSESLHKALSAELNNDQDFMQFIPPEQRYLFPQFGVNSSWAPSMLLHGTSDTAVSVEESRNMARMLRNAGVSVELIELGGEEHSFDYAPHAADMYREQFDKVRDFLSEWLSQVK